MLLKTLVGKHPKPFDDFFKISYAPAELTSFQMGTENMSAYLRKMAIDGYVVNLDMPELRELTSKMKRISNSENQIAKQLNTSGNIYEADIEEIKKNQEEIYEGIKKILLSLSHLK